MADAARKSAERVMVRCVAPGEPLPKPVQMRAGDSLKVTLVLTLNADRNAGVHFGHIILEDPGAIAPVRHRGLWSRVWRWIRCASW